VGYNQGFSVAVKTVVMATAWLYRRCVELTWSQGETEAGTMVHITRITPQLKPR